MYALILIVRSQARAQTHDSQVEHSAKYYFGGLLDDAGHVFTETARVRVGSIEMDYISLRE